MSHFSSERMNELLVSGKYSDFKIHCKTRTWSVHRAIICPQSEYFTTLCDSKFKEASDGEIDLTAESVDDIEQMLKFMYTGDYDKVENKPPPLSPSEEEEPPTNWEDEIIDPAILNQQRNVSMFITGDKYRIKRLETHAALRFTKSLPKKWSDDYWTVVDDIYHQTTDRSELRDSILGWWLADSLALLRDNKFRQQLMEYPDLEIKLLRMHLNEVHDKLTALEKLPEEVSRLSLALKSSELTRAELKTNCQEKVLEVFSSFECCRNCYTDFNSCFDTSTRTTSNELDVIMRCRKCKAKHPAGAR